MRGLVLCLNTALISVTVFGFKRIEFSDTKRGANPF